MSGGSSNGPGDGRFDPPFQPFDVVDVKDLFGPRPHRGVVTQIVLEGSSLWEIQVALNNDFQWTASVEFIWVKPEALKLVKPTWWRKLWWKKYPPTYIKSKRIKVR